MSTALHERPGVVAGLLAFLAATVAGLGTPLRGDLSGPVGAGPSLATDLLAVALAPGLAAYLGYRAVRSERITAKCRGPSLRRPSARWSVASSASRPGSRS